MLDVWLRAATVTQDFLSDEHVSSMKGSVEYYLESSIPEIWVLSSESRGPVGFIGMSGSHIDALFLAPDFQRCGWGRRLVAHVSVGRSELTVNVTEQNQGARRFYENCGFVVVERSELEYMGKSYPQLHMRLRKASAHI